MQMIDKLNILRDFSEYPKLRYETLSDNSAEKFYHECLNSRFADCFKFKKKLEVNIDKTAGYTSSFLDEAFGNLVYDFGLKNVIQFLIITSYDEPYWLDMINEETFPQWENRRIQNQEPKKTILHPPWYRFIDNNLELNIWINV